MESENRNKFLTADKQTSYEKMKRCIQCKQKLPADAKKCISCGSWQNWKQYINFSSSLLSVIVALVSVLAFAIPIWTDALIPETDFSSATLIEVDETGLGTFVLTNGGRQNFVLEYIYLALPNNDVLLKYDLTHISNEDRIVKSNEIGVYKARLSIDNTISDMWDLLRSFRAIYPDDNKCIIQAGILTPKGNRIYQHVNAETNGSNEKDREKKCLLKTKNTIVNTISYLKQKPSYHHTLCRISKEHPKEPTTPSLSEECQKVLGEQI